MTHLRKMMLEELQAVIIPKIPHASTSAQSKISQNDSSVLQIVWVQNGDSGEADRYSELIAITVPGWIRSVVGAKRRWRMDFPESDRDRQACCC